MILRYFTWKAVAIEVAILLIVLLADLIASVHIFVELTQFSHRLIPIIINPTRQMKESKVTCQHTLVAKNVITDPVGFAPIRMEFLGRDTDTVIPWLNRSNQMDPSTPVR